MIADAPPPIEGSLSIDAFGASYHTNRVVRWNERNPGLGVTVAFRHNDACDFIISAGTYRDSLFEQAKYAMCGLRFTLGDREGLHATAGASVGILDGSGNQGLDILPLVSFGYDRVDLFVTGIYQKNGDGERDNTGHLTPKNVSTSVVACFLSFTVLRF